MLAEDCPWSYDYSDVVWDLLWPIAQGVLAHLSPTGLQIKRLG